MGAKLYVTDGGRQSSGFFAEKRDCTVRSFACAADVPYSEAHRIMKKSGRRNGHGWWSRRGLDTAVADGLLEFMAMPCVNLVYATYPTLAQVIARHPRGRYIICTGKHAMALIDGVIHDTGLVGLRSRVKNIFLVKPKQLQPVITQSQINELWDRLNRLEAV